MAEVRRADAIVPGDGRGPVIELNGHVYTKYGGHWQDCDCKTGGVSLVVFEQEHGALDKIWALAEKLKVKPENVIHARDVVGR